MGNMHKQFGKGRACGSGDIQSDRQTDIQTHRRTDTQTDALIAILCNVRTLHTNVKIVNDRN